MKRPIILLTGGGTAGHVSVNEALIPVFMNVDMKFIISDPMMELKKN